VINSGSCGDIPTNVFETVTDIEELGIYCQMSGYCDNMSTFVPQIPIGKLDFVNCITTFSDFFLAQFTSMSILIIRWSPLEEINTKAFLHLPNITTLELTDNEINVLPHFQYENSTVFPNLLSLNLDRNKLELLPASCFLGLHELRYLFLSNNQIRTFFSTTFLGLVHLQRIDISGNKIAIWPDYVFTPLVSLSSLNLSDTGILQQINVKSFMFLTLLTELDVDKNFFFSLPPCLYSDIAIFPNLKLLTMNKNKDPIGIYINFERCFYNLRMFSMKDSFLIRLNEFDFAQLRRLKQLDLTGTKMETIEKYALWSNSLTKITLSNAVIDTIHSEVFESASAVTFINLSNIHIDKIILNGKYGTPQRLGETDQIRLTFRNMKSLNTLDLSGYGTEIITLDEETFRNSTSLKFLYLRKTGINFVRYTSLPSALWSSLLELDLSENPFVCDCRLVWFRRWLDRIQITKTKVLRLNDSYAYTCSFPIQDFGKSILGRNGPLTLLNELRCFSNDENLDSVFVVECIFLMIVVILSMSMSLLYRYRWHIHYWHIVMKVRIYMGYSL